VKGPAIEPGHSESVGVTWTTSAPFGEQDDRKAKAFGHVEEPILLAMILLPLSAGQNRVVVRHHDCATIHTIVAPSVDLSDTSDETVSRCFVDQLVERTTPTLSGDDERPVFDE
jgi:hypothetical protein